MKKNKGFTLVELLAVIVILGILISFSSVAVVKLKKKQDLKNRYNVINSIMTGAKKYIADNPSKVVDQVSVKDLVDQGYIDLDINKYQEFYYNNSAKTRFRTVNFSKCEDNSLKREIRFYDATSIGIINNNHKFTDCGCEIQETGNTKMFCEQGTYNVGKYAGWDLNGKYFDNTGVANTGKNLY